MWKVPLAAVCAAVFAAPLTQVEAASIPAATPAIVGPISASVTKSLDYDVPLALHKTADKGAIPDETLLQGLHLVLKRPAASQAALDKIVADQLDRKSPQYHQWLKPTDFAQFGPADADVAKIVSWLGEVGFKVEGVSSDKMLITFTGTAGQVRDVFKTDLHQVVTRDGAMHMANLSAPSIPAALTGVVHGVTLSNFFPRPNLHAVGQVSRSPSGKTTIVKRAPEFTIPVTGGYYLALAPEDLATIYSITPARNGDPNLPNPATGSPLPITGQGVSLIVAEQTDIKTGDWNEFRKLFGLSKYSAGKLSVVHPGCADPGFTGDEGEAALDSEWSSAVAPAAEIVFASCPETATTFGVMATLEGLLSEKPKGVAISISYGGCEVGNGLSFLHEWTSLIEKAAAQGYSVFVSAGDGAGAGCDNDNTAIAATGGLAVNGLASNPYDTSAGGTDFSDTADGVNGEYWTLNNDANLGSARSYIPEIPWDDSCASSVFLKFVGSPDPIDNCNSSTGAPFLNIVGGGGGRSLYYAKPSWQYNVKGMPNDGARDQPDVSMFASNGIWSHFYVFCMSDANEGGAPCSTTNVNDILSAAAGGTSFVAPILAGVQALVVQAGIPETGASGPVGNAAPVYYELAKLQFETPYLLTTCQSNLGARISSACVFNEITRGNDAVPCVVGTPDCFSSKASTAGYGVLSESTTKEEPAFNTVLGYSLATGLGSLNVTNVLINYYYP